MPSYVAGVFNVGTDLSVVIVDNSTGSPVSLGGRVIEFEASSKKTTITSMPIDNKGYNQHRYTYEGWTGTITFDRETGDLDNLEAAMEAAYHQGGAQRYFTVSVTVKNSKDNSTNIYQFNYAVLSQESTGNWKKDSQVQVKLRIEAQERVVIQAQ